MKRSNPYLYYAALLMFSFMQIFSLSHAQIEDLPTFEVPELIEDLPETRAMSSGGVIVGVQFGSLDKVISSANLVISGIQSTDAYICIDLGHVAGRYTGKTVVKNPDLGGTVIFKLPATLLFSSSLGVQTTSEISSIAMGARDKNCMNGTFLPVAWSEGAPPKRLKLFLLLSENVTPDLYLAYSDNESLCYSAEELLSRLEGDNEKTDKSIINFSHVCEIDFEIECSKETEFSIFLERTDRYAPPVEGSVRRECK